MNHFLEFEFIAPTTPHINDPSPAERLNDWDEMLRLDEIEEKEKEEKDSMVTRKTSRVWEHTRKDIERNEENDSWRTLSNREIKFRTNQGKKRRQLGKMAEQKAKQTEKIKKWILVLSLIIAIAICYLWYVF